MMRIKAFLKASALVGIYLGLSVISLQAASLSVTTTADGGIGSLRQAIIDATINAEANTVTFNIPTSDPGYNVAAYRFTITLSSPLPNIPLAPMTLDNPRKQGITVSGENGFRVLSLVDSAVVTINNLTISNGAAGANPGGGIFMGNSATLTLNGCTVSNSSAATGGGIYMSNSGTVTLTNSTVSGNTAINGGGVYIFDSGTLNMTGSTIQGNMAGTGSGGGIYNGVSGTINATNNTLDGNSAGNQGGGIYNAATMTANSNTVSGNTASAGGGIFNGFVATLHNNIIATNTANDGNDLAGRASLGQAFTGSYNLVGNATGSEGLDGTSQLGTSKSPINPLLGPLQFNGGPTFTRGLLHGSRAIDKGNTPGLINDQRNFIRAHDNLSIPNAAGGNAADIGAYEVSLTPSAEFVTISGRLFVYGEFGPIVSGATVYLTSVDGGGRRTTTNRFGYYYFTDVPSGETYMLSAKSVRYYFTPEAANISGDVSDWNLSSQQ